jgi:hypothetical protein
MPVRFEHKLKGCPAEKSKPLRIIFMPVKNASVKEVPVRMGFNKKTFSSVHETEKDRAVHTSLIKRDPEVVIDHLKSVYLVIPHAVVFRQDDLDIVSPYLEFVAQTVNNVCEAPYFGSRGALRRDHNNIHLLPLIIGNWQLTTFYHNKNQITAKLGRGSVSRAAHYGF